MCWSRNTFKPRANSKTDRLTNRPTDRKPPQHCLGGDEALLSNVCAKVRSRFLVPLSKKTELL